MLLVDFADETDPDAALGDLVKRCGPQTRVIAIGTINDVTLFRRLAARGVADYLVKPVSSEVLCDALRRAIAQRDRDAERKRRARIHAVIGARGGVGASTLALSRRLAPEPGAQAADGARSISTCISAISRCRSTSSRGAGCARRSSIPSAPTACCSPRPW